MHRPRRNVGTFLPRRYSRAYSRFFLSLALLASIFCASFSSPASAEPSYMERLCTATIEKNIVDRARGIIQPSPLYPDGQWLRDSFWTTGGIDDPALKRAAFARFASHLVQGQVPTRLTQNGAILYEDESNMLFLIWAYRDHAVLGNAFDDSLNQAWTWLRQHVSDGQYWTSPGIFHTWHDTLYFPEWDVASYNQGLYVTAAHAAAALRLPVSEQEIEAAAAGYRRLYRPDLLFLPASLKLPYHDISSVTGEFLLRQMFNRTALRDEQVVSTISRHPGSDVGFLVLSRPDGGYLPYKAFDPPLNYGDYQNGGSWFLYDYLALLVARRAGWSEASRYIAWRQNVELSRGALHEYLMTQPAGSIPRPDYAWNAFACRYADWR